MKRFLKHNLFLIILILVFLVSPFISNAGDFGDGNPGDPGCNPYGYRWDGTQWILCPIDDGLYVLLGIGVLYGIKKVRDQKKAAPRSSLKEN
jgi:hypothetical protein